MASGILLSASLTPTVSPALAILGAITVGRSSLSETSVAGVGATGREPSGAATGADPSADAITLILDAERTAVVPSSKMMRAYSGSF
jgi:hypothetical protein